MDNKLDQKSKDEIATFRQAPIEALIILLCNTIYLVGGAICVQYGVAGAIIGGYIIAGTCANCATLGMHEASHDLIFGPKYKILNHIAGIFSTIPLVVPGYFPFRKYHLIHHGKTNVGGFPPGDPDLPSGIEYKIFNSNIIGRFFGMFLQPIAYSLRPLLFYKYIPSIYDTINLAINAAILYYMILNYGLLFLVYALSGILIGLSFNPTAMHFYAEHHATSKNEALLLDTWSYYGFWNFFIYNVGYHREHHDNCGVAGIYLPKFKQLWGDKYNTHGEGVHESYTQILFNLLTMKWSLYRRCHREFQGSNDFTMVPDYLFLKEKVQ